MVQFHRRIDDDGRQGLALATLLGEGDHVLLLLAFQLVRVGDHAFQRAELLHQFHRGLLADARNAGNVVHRITHQPEDVLHLIGGLQSPPFAHLLRPEFLAEVAAATRLCT